MDSDLAAGGPIPNSVRGVEKELNKERGSKPRMPNEIPAGRTGCGRPSARQVLDFATVFEKGPYESRKSQVILRQFPSMQSRFSLFRSGGKRGMRNLRILGFFVLFVAAALLLLLAPPGLAQEGSWATLTGSVTTEGTDLPGVKVSVTSPSLQGTRSTASSVNGDYILPLLPPGQYEVTFELSGFQTHKQSIKLNAAQTSRLDVNMRLSSVAAEATVTASQETISQTQKVSTTYTAETLEKLPVGRTFQAAVLLAPELTGNGPGANATTAVITISGAQSFENLFLVNGVVVNDNLRGQPLSLFIEDAIQRDDDVHGRHQRRVRPLHGRRRQRHHEVGRQRLQRLVPDVLRERRLDRRLPRQGDPRAEGRFPPTRGRWAARSSRTSSGSSAGRRVKRGELGPGWQPDGHHQHPVHRRTKESAGREADVLARPAAHAHRRTTSRSTRRASTAPSSASWTSTASTRARSPSSSIRANYAGTLTPKLFLEGNTASASTRSRDRLPVHGPHRGTLMQDDQNGTRYHTRRSAAPARTSCATTRIPRQGHLLPLDQGARLAQSRRRLRPSPATSGTRTTTSRGATTACRGRRRHPRRRHLPGLEQHRLVDLLPVQAHRRARQTRPS